jgi:antitoxin VapB
MTRIPAAKDPTRNVSLPGEKMRKDGARLTIEPTPPKSLLAVLSTLSPLEDDFPPIAELALDPVRF